MSSGCHSIIYTDDWCTGVPASPGIQLFSHTGHVACPDTWPRVQHVLLPSLRDCWSTLLHWSTHCSYKSGRVCLQQFQQSIGPGSLCHWYSFCPCWSVWHSNILRKCSNSTLKMLQLLGWDNMYSTVEWTEIIFQEMILNMNKIFDNSIRYIPCTKFLFSFSFLKLSNSR